MSMFFFAQVLFWVLVIVYWVGVVVAVVTTLPLIWRAWRSPPRPYDPLK
jgi:hypothetical protein